MDKQALLAYINRAIVILGTTRVRVDELGTVGVPVSEAIQNLGEAVKLIDADEEEAKGNEQENSNESE